MGLFRKKRYFLVVIGVLFLLLQYVTLETVYAKDGFTWDIKPYGSLRYWSDQTGVLGEELDDHGLIEVPQSLEMEWNFGIWWQEPRDIHKLELIYKGEISESLLKETKIQYWFQTWPGEVPSSFTYEDHLDDPWQGSWITANTHYHVKGDTVVYSFNPLANEENSNAKNLPGPVIYRRTLKIRLLYNQQPPIVQSLRVVSPTDSKKLSVRIQLEGNGHEENFNEGTLEIYNGQVKSVTGWNWETGDRMTTANTWKFQISDQPKGIIADKIAAEPTLSGSTDQTIVTVRSSGAVFSFLVDDLKKGPIYIPVYSVLITDVSDTTEFIASNIKQGQRIREKLEKAPEQTYDRARREIPELSVMEREPYHTLYLPLAPDASWQKFGFEWGGGIYMNKHLTKAKGKELERCNWAGDRFQWSFGTGKDPVYLRDDKKSHLSILDDYLPVAQADWIDEGLLYREEGFATLLEGPLSPYDPARSEQTAAIMAVKFHITNPTNQDKVSHVWIKGEPINRLAFQDGFIMERGLGKSYIRAKIDFPEEVDLSDVKVINKELYIPVTIPANQETSIYIYFPFVGDLKDDNKEKFIPLDYNAERQRVVSYWREIVEKNIAFNVPEPKFNIMVSSVVPHIRISTTKDPKSGLFMVPAASFRYEVFANEAAFQTLYLDKIGDHKTAESYLETFMKLQGNEPLPGTFTGDQSGVYNGARVDSIYNYTSVHGYNMNQGAVLWALAKHFLWSHDKDWLRRAAPSMLKAVDWIVTQRRQTKVLDRDGQPALSYGLLPAGQLEDNTDWGYWFAVNAYASMGLTVTAEAFKKGGLAEAEYLSIEAQDYLHDLRTSIKRSIELCPVVRLRDNTYVPYVPARAYQRFRYFGPLQTGYHLRYGVDSLSDNRLYRLSATREVLYGPMVLLTTGIITPNDPLADAILDDWEDNLTLSSSMGQNIHGIVDDEYWFSRGGMVFQPNLQNPIQAYLLRNEIPATIRNIYNSMVSCLYPDINAFTEEYRKWGVGSGHMYKTPDEARFVSRIIDLLAMEAGDELWLASGTPRYWLDSGKVIRLYHASTIYGKVSYELKAGKRHNTVEAVINLPGNVPENKVKLFIRAPFDKKLQQVYINKKLWENWDSEQEYIILPASKKKIDLVAIY